MTGLYARDDADFDGRQRASEEAYEDALHASTSFFCEACQGEFDVSERVILTRHPEMPAICMVCVCTQSAGGRTYP